MSVLVLRWPTTTKLSLYQKVDQLALTQILQRVIYESFY